MNILAVPIIALVAVFLACVFGNELRIWRQERNLGGGYRRRSGGGS